MGTIKRKICFRWVIIMLIVVTFVVYALCKTKNLMLGPSLTLTNPTQAKTVGDSSLEVTGTSARIAKIYLNDRQIFTTADGSFHEPLLLSYGYNMIKVRAEDRFGRQVERTAEVVLK